MVPMTTERTTDADTARLRVPGPQGHGKHRLDPAALKYHTAVDLILAVVGTPLLAAATLLIPDHTWRTGALIAIVALSVIGLLVDIPFVNRWEVRNTSYTVTPDVVFIRRGLLIRRTTTISTAQILNVEVVQGPLLRAFGLVKVRFTCISEVEGITGITESAAAEIRDIILRSQNEADGADHD